MESSTEKQDKTNQPLSVAREKQILASMKKTLAKKVLPYTLQNNDKFQQVNNLVHALNHSLSINAAETKARERNIFTRNIDRLAATLQSPTDNKHAFLMIQELVDAVNTYKKEYADLTNEEQHNPPRILMDNFITNAKTAVNNHKSLLLCKEFGSCAKWINSISQALTGQDWFLKEKTKLASIVTTISHKENSLEGHLHDTESFLNNPAPHP